MITQTRFVQITTKLPRHPVQRLPTPEILPILALMPKRNLTWVVLLVLTAGVVYWLRPAPPPPTNPGNVPVKPEMPLVQEAREVIREQSAEQISETGLQEGAVQGMVEALDAHSSYYPPELAATLAAQSQGQYTGIGVELEPRDGRLVVLARMDGSPAAAAGLLPGDIIFSIAGDLADALRPEEAIHRLSGPAGSSVEVAVLRPSTGERIRRCIPRAVIETSSVRGWLRQPGGQWDWFVGHTPPIAYLRIQSFQARTAEELNQAVLAALRQGAVGVILDLRFNPGGQFTSAIDCADLFLTQGPIVTQHRSKNQSVTSQARPEGTLPPVPVAILVNRYTASAAEVFAGALHDRGRALVLGERTWGKGTIQNFIRLSNGGLLKLTTARWILPGGTSLHRENGAKTWGVQPDVSVPMASDDYALLFTLRERVDAARLRAATQPAGLASTARSQPATEDEVEKLLNCDRELKMAIACLRHLATQPTTQPGVVDLSSLPSSTTAPSEE